ncbi:MAG: hydrogenase maturation nickel metallochaperone HypA [Gemmatimonadota bacterium]
MHELSLAHGIVEQSAEAARNAGAAKVLSVRIKVGALAGVEPGALLFCYEVASKETLLEGSRLEILYVPLVVWCAHCLKEVELEGVQSLRCPSCGTPCGEIRRGRELQVESVEIES